MCIYFLLKEPLCALHWVSFQIMQFHLPLSQKQRNTNVLALSRDSIIPNHQESLMDCPAGAAHVLQEQRLDDVCFFFILPTTARSGWLQAKGHPTWQEQPPAWIENIRKKNVWRTWIWQDWVGFRQKLVTADSLVALFAPEEKGINDKHTHAVGKRLISRYQIKPANTAKGLACLQYASYNNGSMVITGTQRKRGK